REARRARLESRTCADAALLHLRRGKAGGGLNSRLPQARTGVQEAAFRRARLDCYGPAVAPVELVDSQRMPAIVFGVISVIDDVVPAGILQHGTVAWPLPAIGGAEYHRAASLQ